MIPQLAVLLFFTVYYLGHGLFSGIFCYVMGIRCIANYLCIDNNQFLEEQEAL